MVLITIIIIRDMVLITMNTAMVLITMIRIMVLMLRFLYDY